MNQRKAEFSNMTELFTAFDAGYVSGAIGWYCDKCKGILVDDIQIYQATCTRKDSSSAN